MKRISLIAMVMILASAASVHGEPILIGSFDYRVDEILIENSLIGFVLQHTDVGGILTVDGPPLGGISDNVRLGPFMFWEDGQSGVLEFTSQTDPLFDDFANLLTDGVDDSLIVFWEWIIGDGFGGGGAQESELFGLDTDLFGNDIVTVHGPAGSSDGFG